MFAKDLRRSPSWKAWIGAAFEPERSEGMNESAARKVLTGRWNRRVDVFLILGELFQCSLGF
jgi:hypothetical protein